jgi:hypothetical protein
MVFLPRPGRIVLLSWPRLMVTAHEAAIKASNANRDRTINLISLGISDFDQVVFGTD